MAYNKQNFQDGQILTAANLEKMENGIIAGQGAENLLDNSDFSNYINSRGGISTAGTWDYCIDRWRAFGTAGQLVWHNSDHVALGALRGINQEIKNKSRFVGKTYTLAAKDADGVLYITSGTYGGDNSHIWKETNGMELRLYSVSDDNNIYFSLKNLSSDTSKFIYLKWAALYEGSYTVDTLPPYIPKGKHVEMLNCNVPLAPRNLLDNSDFRIKNNIINTKGLTDYSLDSGDVFDRWRLHWTGDGRVSIKDGYIELYRKTHSTYLYQHPKDLESMIGKTYTVAAKVRYNGLIGWIDSTQRVNSGTLALNDWDIATCTFTVGSATSDIGKAGIEIATKADLSFEVQWVALYEGAYTKETLPPYVPKGKHVEMLNCGVSLTPRNLLDNSDFTNPVNQRGTASGAVITGWDYFIDRWQARAENCSVNFSGEGITASTPIGQILPKETVKNGMTVTAAAKWSDGTICVASGAIRRTNEWGSFSSANINGHSLYVSDEGDGNHACITISGGTVVWAALYEGSYDASTLPAYQPKGYAAELAECQRYFIRVSNSAAYGIISGTGCVVKVPLPTTMRNGVTPTATLDSAAWAYTHEGYVGLTFIGTMYSTNTASLHFTLETETSARCCVVPDLSFNISANL